MQVGCRTLAESILRAAMRGRLAIEYWRRDTILRSRGRPQRDDRSQFREINQGESFPIREVRGRSHSGGKATPQPVYPRALYFRRAIEVGQEALSGSRVWVIGWCTLPASPEDCCFPIRRKWPGPETLAPPTVTLEPDFRRDGPTGKNQRAAPYSAAQGWNRRV